MMELLLMLPAEQNTNARFQFGKAAAVLFFSERSDY